MPTQPARKFTILDGMILVAATAVGVAIVRRQWELYLAPRFFTPPPSGRSFRSIADQGILLVGFLLSHCVAMWTLAVLASDLAGPRPGLRRLGRRPGFVACCAVALSVALSEARTLIRGVLFGVGSAFEERHGFTAELAEALMNGLGLSFTVNGLAVATAWMTLTLGRRWRPEPNWIDRAGRALGVYWLAMLPLYSWLAYTHGG